MLLSQVIASFLPISFPGSVLGMVFLYILLKYRMLKVEQVEIASNFLLDNLAFFFIPAGVGLISSLNIIQSYGLVLLLIVFITTVLVMGITAWIVEKMMKNIPDELD